MSEVPPILTEICALQRKSESASMDSKQRSRTVRLALIPCGSHPRQRAMAASPALAEECQVGPPLGRRLLATPTSSRPAHSPRFQIDESGLPPPLRAPCTSAINAAQRQGVSRPRGRLIQMTVCSSDECRDLCPLPCVSSNKMKLPAGTHLSSPSLVW